MDNKPKAAPEGESETPKLCPDCAEIRRHAYSDATTPGFFYTECEKHRKPSAPSVSTPEGAEQGAGEAATKVFEGRPVSAKHTSVRDFHPPFRYYDADEADEYMDKLEAIIKAGWEARDGQGK